VVVALLVVVVVVVVVSSLLISSSEKRSDSTRASLGDSLTSKKKWSTHTSRTVASVGDTFADDGVDGNAQVDVDTVESIPKEQV
jgi:hypothetical protein